LPESVASELPQSSWPYGRSKCLRLHAGRAESLICGGCGDRRGGGQGDAGQAGAHQQGGRLHEGQSPGATLWLQQCGGANNADARCPVRCPRCPAERVPASG